MTLIHNGCSLCLQTEGTCWRDAVAERYRAVQSWRDVKLSRSKSRFMRRPLMAVMLAPIFGAIAGGALGTAIWFVVRLQMMGFGAL